MGINRFLNGLDKQAAVISFFVFSILLISTYCCTAICLKKEKGKNNNKVTIDTKLVNSTILYYLISILVMSSSFILYNEFVNYFTKDILISSGIILPVWLLSTGIIIRLLYFVLFKLSKSQIEKLNEEDVKSILLTSTLILVFFGFSVDAEFPLIILSILIGRFIWIDSTCEAYKEFINIYKNSSQITRKILTITTFIYIFILSLQNIIGLEIFLGILAGVLGTIMLLMFLIIIIVKLNSKRSR